MCQTMLFVVLQNQKCCFAYICSFRKDQLYEQYTVYSVFRVQIMRPVNWLKVVTVALIPFITASLWLITADFTNVPLHCRGIVKGN